MDTNDDTLVSLDELHKVCQLVQAQLTPDEVDNLFHTIDTSKNGTIEFDEFAKAYATGLTAGHL